MPKSERSYWKKGTLFIACVNPDSAPWKVTRRRGDHIWSTPTNRRLDRDYDDNYTEIVKYCIRLTREQIVAARLTGRIQDEKTYNRLMEMYEDNAKGS